MGFSFGFSSLTDPLAVFPQLSSHDHFFHVYETEVEQLEWAARFLETVQTEPAHGVLIADSERGDALLHQWEERKDSRLRTFDPNRVKFLSWDSILEWDAITWERLLQSGITGREKAVSGQDVDLRIVVDFSRFAAMKDPLPVLLGLERELCRMVETHHCAIVCQYDKNYFSTTVLKELLDLHSMIVFRGRISRNVLYHPPDPEGGVSDSDISVRLSELQRLSKIETHWRRNEERLELALDSSLLGLWDWNLQTGEMDLNPHWLKVLGYDPEEIEATYAGWERLIHPKDRAMAAEAWREHLRGDTEAFETEYRVTMKSGRWKWVLDRGRVVHRTAQGEAVRALGTFTDISRSKSIEKILRDSRTELAAVFDHAPVMMLLIDQDLKIIKMNRTAMQQTGLDGISPAQTKPILRCFNNLNYREDCLPGLNCRDCLLRKTVEETLSGNVGVNQVEFRLPVSLEVPPVEQTFLLSTSYLLMQNNPYVLLSLEDVSERRQLEQQLLQAQKMEALGRLAGGVAHDFNNLLQVIDGYLELAQMNEGLDSVIRLYMAEIQKASKRAASITRQLLAFSRKPTNQAEIIDLNALVGEMKNLFQRILGEDIHFEIHLRPNLGYIEADHNHLEQAVLNLVVNAREAMPSGGRLRIETDEVRLEPHQAGFVLPVEGREYISLKVIDSGGGISQETAKHIFEPFYTTKGKGKGTGLGLSMVYGFMQQARGNIGLLSTPGEGTVFQLLWPKVGHTQQQKEAPPVELNYAGHESILVVEDDDAVRNLTRQILNRQGYKVVEARNGREAWEYLQNREEPLNLLLTDVVMPEMGGPELAKKVQSAWPETKILFMSGYANDQILSHGITSSEKNLIQKPFRSQTLTKKIREVLDQ